MPASFRVSSDGAAILTRVGAASTHTQVQWDQMPKGYVSFDSGILLVLVSIVAYPR